ncbi:MAG: hypothetical protein ACYCX4_01060 [Bacillota bacterium]
MEDYSPEMQEVLEILRKIKPNWQDDTRGFECGSSKVRESIFAFGHHFGHYYWITLLYECPFIAFKQITPAWIQAYSNLILASPEVFVEYDKCRRIVEWATAQDKKVD